MALLVWKKGMKEGLHDQGSMDKKKYFLNSTNCACVVYGKRSSKWSKSVKNDKKSAEIHVYARSGPFKNPKLSLEKFSIVFKIQITLFSIAPDYIRSLILE